MKKQAQLGRPKTVKSKDAKKSHTVSISEADKSLLKKRFGGLTNALNYVIDQVKEENTK